MIIARKYEWLGELYANDRASRKIIDDSFDLVEMDESQKKEILDYNDCNIPAFLNIGCGIPGTTYAAIIEGFERLDKEQPYDNGLTFNDVNRIEYESSRHGNAIQMRYVKENVNCPYRIVAFVAIEEKNGSIRKCKRWEMAAPFIVG